MKLEEIDKLLSEITQGELTACVHQYVLNMGDAGKWIGHIDDQHGRGLASFCIGTEVPGIGKVTKKEAIANCKLYAAAPTIIKELVERVRLLKAALVEIKTGEVEVWDDGEEQIVITNMDEEEMQKIAADVLDELAAREQDDAEI